jgi:HEAT repeat protein
VLALITAALAAPPELAVALDPHAGDRARIAAVRRLGELGDPSAVVPLLHTLPLELSEPLLAEIRRALERIGAARVLTGDLQSPDAEKREAAANLLARAGDPAAIPALTVALADPVADVREEAAATLGILGASRAENAIADLLTRDADPDVRMAAAQALALLDTPSARATLQRARQTEADPFVRAVMVTGDAERR